MIKKNNFDPFNTYGFPASFLRYHPHFFNGKMSFTHVYGQLGMTGGSKLLKIVSVMRFLIRRQAREPVKLEVCYYREFSQADLQKGGKENIAKRNPRPVGRHRSLMLLTSVLSDDPPHVVTRGSSPPPGSSNPSGKKELDWSYLAGMISERSPAGMNSRIAPFANSRRGSEKSNLSAGSANVIFISGERVHASWRP